MTKKKNPLVFMDVSIDGDPREKMVFEVFTYLHLSNVWIGCLAFICMIHIVAFVNGGKSEI